MDSNTDRPKDIVDWADAIILPFSVALWGLKSVC